jgi:hypothetical protein
MMARKICFDTNLSLVARINKTSPLTALLLLAVVADSSVTQRMTNSLYRRQGRIM